jgi:hypothetical protein
MQSATSASLPPAAGLPDAAPRPQVDPPARNATALAANSRTSSQGHARLKATRVLEAEARGSACFDAQHYKSGHPDLQAVADDSELWRHYMYFGQFEGRAARFSCDFDRARLLRILEAAA